MTTPPKRAFLSDPIAFSFQPITKTELNPPSQAQDNYYDEIPKQRNLILLSNQAHEILCQQHNLTYNFKIGKIPANPFKFIPNLLGIHSIAKSFVHGPYSSLQEPLIIETGNRIHSALTAKGFEAFYFEKYGRIIVLNSSMLALNELQMIFERHAFTTGFYPYIDSDRTKFDDWKIHLSHESPPRKIPFRMPDKEEIYNYLIQNPMVLWNIAPHIIHSISEKLVTLSYIPNNTIYNLAKEFSLEPNPQAALESALIRYPKGIPSWK